MQVQTNTLAWIKAAGIRAIKTMAQVLISFIGVGMAMSDIDWLSALSVTLVSGILSVLTSIVGLPEVNPTAGTLNIDTTGEKDKYSFDVGDNLGKLQNEKKVTLDINVKKRSNVWHESE